MSLLSPILYRAQVIDLGTGLLTRPFADWLAMLLERAGGSGEAPTTTDLEALIALLPGPLPLLVPDADPFAAPPMPGPQDPGPWTWPPDAVRPDPDPFGAGRPADLPDPDPFMAPMLALPDLPTEASLSGVLAQIAALTDSAQALELATQATLATLQQALDDLTLGVAWAETPGVLERPGYFGAPPTGAITAAGAGANATLVIGGNDTRGVLTLNTSALDTPLAASDIATITFARPWGRQAPSVVLMPADDNAWGLAYGTVLVRQNDTTRTLFKLRSGVTALPALTALQYQWSYHVLG